MMPTHPASSPLSGRTRAATLLAALALVARLAAQSVPPATAVKEDTIVLSPFTVSSDADRGYQALNTLSGTRLNSKLEDLGASITVVTKQQMEDFAMLDINDVFRYEASTEGTDNFTTFNRNRSGGVNDQVQSDPQRSNRIRGMTAAGQSVGGANTAWGNFSSNSNIPFDPYNIAAIEISRGPNSNLFGLGQAAGTVSVVPSQANPNRQSFSGDLRFDSYGGRRESLNLNLPLIPGKAAVRVASVDEAKGFIRQPASERIHRAFATVLVRPFPSTTFRASAEKYIDVYRRPNAITARDTTSEWRAAGSPTWDPTTQMVTLANGTKSGPFTADTRSVPIPGLGISTNVSTLPAGLIGGYNGFYSHPMVIVDDNSIQAFSVMKSTNPLTSGFASNPFSTANSTLRYLTSGTEIMRQRDVLGPGGLPLYIVPGTNDQSVYDWTKYNVVAPNHGEDQASTYSAELEQIILNTPHHLVAAKLGLFQQKFSRRTYAFIDNLETVIYVDVNEKRLDGSPNPYFKRPYIQATAPNMQYNPQNNTIGSADLAYQLTPGTDPKWRKWIGVQRFALHAEQNTQDSTAWKNSARVADLNHPWINPAANQNLVGVQSIGQRFFLGDTQGQNVDYGAAAIDNIIGSYPLTWFNNRTGKWAEEPVTVAEVLDSGAGARQRTEIRTFNATAQNYFLNDRLVLTAGFRRDRYRQRTGAGGYVDPKTGLVNTSINHIFGPAQGYFTAAGIGPINLPGWSDLTGDTKTYGGVVKALSWLSFHVNKSDSFTPQVVRQSVADAGNVPNPHGYVTEWGLSFTALQGKLNVRLNHFQTKELASRGSEVGTLGNRYLDMEGRPDGSNNIQLSSFRYFATQIALGRLAAQGIKQPTAAQLDPAVATLMGIPDDMYTRLVYSGPSQPQTVGTTDVSSKGFELEATYNPNRNLRMKFTGSQTRARDDQVSPDIYNWWQTRIPVWTSLHRDIVPGDGKGPLWWDTIPPNDSRTPQTRYIQDQFGPYWAAATNAGRPRTQMREYRLAGLANYNFTEGKLKDVNLGGALRWESKASIGYLAGPAETSGPYQGAVLFLDNNKPVWEKARAYLDLSAGYRFKYFGDKIRARAQLNVKNVLENGRLQPIAINPDGRPYAYRIIDPRQFILSLSFEL